MRVTELAAQLKTGMKPVYLIFGPEEHFRTEALRLLKAKAEASKYDITELDAAEIEPRKFFDELRTPSLFAANQLVIVEHAEPLFGAPLKGLIAYASSPSHKTILAISAETLKPKSAKRGGRRKAEEASGGDVMALLKKAVPVECPLLKRNELPAWCIARARELGKKMDSGAAGMLIELAGSSPGQLSGQIQALVSYCKERPNITGDDVSRLVGGDHMRTIWDLLNAIGDRKPASALRALDRLMRDGDISSSGIIGFLATDVRRTLIVKRMHDQRAPLPEIARAAQMQDWLVEKTLRNTRGVSTDDLKRRLHLLVRADADIKTGAAKDGWVMERLVMEMCGGR